MAYKKLITPAQTIDYVSPNDPDTQNPTVFVLKSISATTKAELSIYLLNDNYQLDKNNLIAYYKRLCKEGIKEVKNFEDYEWKGYVDDDFLEILVETKLFIEIGQKILELSTVDAELKKN